VDTADANSILTTRTNGKLDRLAWQQFSFGHDQRPDLLSIYLGMCYVSIFLLKSYFEYLLLKAEINFTNILFKAFNRADPESAKKDWQLICIFCTFGICARKSFA